MHKVWAIRKMMAHYAESGTVQWPEPMRQPERRLAIAEACRSQGIQAMHWLPADGIAIAIREGGLLPDRSGLQLQLSDILSDSVSVKTPGDMRPEQLERYLAQAKSIYPEPDYAVAN